MSQDRNDGRPAQNQPVIVVATMTRPGAAPRVIVFEIDCDVLSSEEIAAIVRQAVADTAAETGCDITLMSSPEPDQG